MYLYLATLATVRYLAQFTSTRVRKTRTWRYVNPNPNTRDLADRGGYAGQRNFERMSDSLSMCIMMFSIEKLTNFLLKFVIVLECASQIKGCTPRRRRSETMLRP